MNKDYCFTFQNHNFDVEPTTNHYQAHTNEDDNLQNDFNFSSRETTVATYEVVPNDEDDDDSDEVLEEKITQQSKITLPKNYSARDKLHLCLNTDKIALKSQHAEATVRKMLNNNNSTINKSMGIDVMQISNCRVLKTKNFNKQNNLKDSLNDEQDQVPKEKQQHGVNINFKIAPLNSTTTAKVVDGEDEHNLPEIVLTSFDTTRSNAIMPLAGTPTNTKLKNENLSKKSNCVKFQGIEQQPQQARFKIVSVSKKAETSDATVTDAEDSSELTSLPGGNSTSPESILDNVLSAASSVSVRSSSSLSSVNSELTQLGVKQNMKKQPTDVMPQVIIITPNEDTLDGSPKTSNNSMSYMPTPAPSSINWLSKKTKIQLSSDMSPIFKRLPSTPQLTPTSTYNSGSSVRSQRSRTPSPSASILLQQQQQQQINFDTSLYPEELKCKICLQIFLDPRTLNCLHSFCYQCISSDFDSNDDKEINGSNGNGRSTFPDVTVRNVTDNSTSPLRSRTLNFMRKKSLDRIIVKQKSDLKLNSMNSCSSRLTLQNNDENKVRYITCKICSFLTELPMGGPRQLPQNLVLLRRIEDFKIKAVTDVKNKIWCNLCYDEISATFHCLKCNLNLCTLCKEAHERQRNTTNHTIKNIMDVRRSKKQRENVLEISKYTLKCSLHPGSELKAFCATCLQVGCGDCLVLLHKNHKIESIQKASNYYSKILRDNIEQTRPLCNYAEHSIERLNDIAKGINKKCDDIQAEVEIFLRQYFEALEVHRRTLLQQVHKARESKVEMIIEQQLDLEKRITEAMDVVRFTQDLTDKATEVEILSFLSLLLKRFEYCQQFKSPVDPKISDSLHFLPKIRAPTTKTQNDIPLFGIITMQTVEPSLCTIQTENVAHLRLHKKIELTCVSRDADNVELCHGGLEIHALLKYKEHNSKFLPVEVSDNRDGTYLICFTPDSQGTLILTVIINDKPIKGNPFIFLARTVRPHSGIYHCCAFCSSKGSKLAKCACDGLMPGYDGCGHGHAGHPGRRHWSCCGNILENSECSFTNKLLNS